MFGFLVDNFKQCARPTFLVLAKHSQFASRKHCSISLSILSTEFAQAWKRWSRVLFGQRFVIIEVIGSHWKSVMSNAFYWSSKYNLKLDPFPVLIGESTTCFSFDFAFQIENLPFRFQASLCECTELHRSTLRSSLLSQEDQKEGQSTGDLSRHKVLKSFLFSNFFSLTANRTETRIRVYRSTLLNWQQATVLSE